MRKSTQRGLAAAGVIRTVAGGSAIRGSRAQRRVWAARERAEAKAEAKAQARAKEADK